VAFVELSQLKKAKEMQDTSLRINKYGSLSIQRSITKDATTAHIFICEDLKRIKIVFSRRNGTGYRLGLNESRATLTFIKPLKHIGMDKDSRYIIDNYTNEEEGVIEFSFSDIKAATL
jgi:hypothetical protein